MLKNNLIDKTSFSQSIKDSMIKAAGQLPFDSVCAKESVIEGFDFEADNSPVIPVNDWWKVCQDRVCFPVANSVSCPTVDSEAMSYFAGYILSKHDTTIPVYQHKVRYGILFDLYASCMASILIADYQMARLFYQAARQFVKYFSTEEQIEEVEQAVIDDIDCYLL